MAMVELENGFSFRMRPLNENGLRGAFIKLSDGTEIRILCLKGNNEACEITVTQGKQEMRLLPTTIEVLWDKDAAWKEMPFQCVPANELKSSFPDGMVLRAKGNAVGFIIH